MNYGIFEDQKAIKELYHSLGGKKYSQIKNIYIKDSWKFGNNLIMLNNMIYYFEILGEKKNIYINNAHHWYIKDKIVTDYVNIEMINDTLINCNDSETICMQKAPWILTPKDYAEYVNAHPEETQPIEEAEYYGLRFRESKPTKENQAMRRAKKKKRAGD